ncbi:MAG: PEGA domain-containing protein [Polyangiaceae bacterium]
MTRRFLALAALVFGTTLAPVARTQQADIAALDAQAAEQEKAGNWQAALETHRKLHALAGGRPPWDNAANHANAAYQVGVYDEAATMLRYALAQLPVAQPDRDAIKGKMEERLAELRAKTGELELGATPTGALIRIDGRDVGRTPLGETVFVLPGAREVQASMDGFVTASQRVEVAPGARASLTLALVPVAPPPGRPPLPPAPPSQPDEPTLSDARLGTGIAAVGLGVGGVVAGIVLGITSVNRGNTADERRAQILADPAAPATNPCGAGAYQNTQCAELDDNAAAERTFRGAAIGAGIAGGLLLTTGILLLALPSGDDGFTVSPSAGPDGAGLLIGGRF